MAWHPALRRHHAATPAHLCLPTLRPHMRTLFTPSGTPPLARRVLPGTRRRVLVTTPIFYVNAAPHIGHLHSALLADALARWHRQQGDDVVFSTGTDEHGIKVQDAAAAAGQDPSDFCSAVSASFREAFDAFDVLYDDYIRTTEPRHIATVRAMWRLLRRRGFIALGTHDGWYCKSDEAFLTSQQVGDAVVPGGATADGIDEADAGPLANGDAHARAATGGASAARGARTRKVSLESGHPVEWISEANYKFALSRFREPLLQWLQWDPTAIQPRARLNEVTAWVERGLQDLSVSRLRERVGWAVPVPDDDDHSVYVWLDALTNYLTVAGTAENGPAGDERAGGSVLRLRRGADGDDDSGAASDASGGGDGDSVALQQPAYWDHTYHVVGKDILRFHAVYWPAFLMAAGMAPPSRIIAHAHWTVGKVKMSKSLGNVVSPADLLEAAGGRVDGVRYFLLREGGLTDDADFSIDAMHARVDADLADTLGNLAARATSPAVLAGGVLPHPGPFTPDDAAFAAAIDAAGRDVGPMYEAGEFARALERVNALLHEANRHFAANEPWKLKPGAPGEDAERLGTVVYLSLEALRVAGVLLRPVIPATADTLLRHLGVDVDADGGGGDWALAVGRHAGVAIGGAGGGSKPRKLVLWDKSPGSKDGRAGGGK